MAHKSSFAQGRSPRLAQSGWAPSVRVVTPATPVRHMSAYFSGPSQTSANDISQSLSVLTMLSPDMKRNVSGGSNVSSDSDATLIAGNTASVAQTPREENHSFSGRLVLSPQLFDDSSEFSGLGIQRSVSFADAVELGLCTDGSRRNSLGFALPDPREQLGVGRSPEKGHARRPTPYPGREASWLEDQLLADEE